MRPALTRAAGILLALAPVLLISLAFASRIERQNSLELPSRRGQSPPVFHSPAMVAAWTDTTLIAHFTFDGPGGADPQGWASHDQNTQDVTYFHVDDFAGLGGGSKGALVPLAGNRSMWCGARTESPPGDICGYATLPGYGNNWRQELRSRVFTVSGFVALQFQAMYDSEYQYDFTDVLYKTKSDRWEVLMGGFSQDASGNPVSGTYAATVPADSLNGTVEFRIRFTSDSIISDEDGGGSFDSDGAVIIDEIQVIHSVGIVDYEDFEGEGVGDSVTTDGDWWAAPTPGYGDFAALYDGLTVLQEDSLVTNATWFWGFFNGSTADYSCGGHPTQAAVPYMDPANAEAQSIYNMVRSPWIAIDEDINGQPLAAPGLLFAFDVYRDLPLDNVVFFVWNVRFRVGGCSTPWTSRSQGYYGDQKDWYRYVHDITDLLPAGATEIQLEVGVWDWCPFYCGTYGSGNCHSHAPLIDNVSIMAARNGYVVTNTNDSGPGSLRQAITDVNADSVDAVISFNIPGTGPHLIQPLTRLPGISNTVLIDGYSQPGASPNTQPFGAPGNASIQIEIDGSLVYNFPPVARHGLTLGGGNSEVRGLAFGNNTGGGVWLSSDNNTVSGCYIGTDASGTIARPNGGGGIGVFVNKIGNVIGGPGPAHRNVISGNTFSNGASLTPGTTLESNYIGVDVTGSAMLMNRHGVSAGASVSDTTGAGISIRGNLVAGNTQHGISLYDYNGSGVDVINNVIGTDITGTLNLGNGTDGVLISREANGVRVGGAGLGNTIRYNGGAGVRVDENYTGTQYYIFENDIDMNGGLGIDIGLQGLTPHNPADAWQDRPEIIGIVPGPSLRMVVRGSGALVRVDLYESPSCDAGGFGEGRQHLGYEWVTSTASVPPDTALISFTPPFNSGWYITATTTDIVAGTSEFSNCFQITNTTTGNNVSVTPVDASGDTPLTLTFDQVTGSGVTTVSEGDCSSPLPGGYVGIDSLNCYEITTTATYGGLIEVCLQYDESMLTQPESLVTLMHYDTTLVPPDWVDATTSLDTVANVVCGEVSTLSPFMAATRDVASAIGRGAPEPAQYTLHQNVPNPFNPVTTIRYEVPPGADRVNIAIYDVAGRLIRRLVDRHQPAGTWNVTWDGRNARGQQVASGVYFYRMRAGTFVQTRKMVLLK